MFLDIDTMADVHFTFKDVAYIVSFLVTLLTAWFKLKHDNERQNDKLASINEKIESCFSDSKEEIMNAKNGRISIRKDFDRKLERVNDEIKTNKENFTNQMAAMNQAISDVKTDTAEIKGMIGNLLNQ